jgi:PHD/YefM family antitoxin component YafN of YafNO toxin-antitoxin module
MSTVTVANFKKDPFKYLTETVKTNGVLSITTEAGNAVILSEKEYNAFLTRQRYEKWFNESEEKQAAKARNDFKNGRTYTHEQVFAGLESKINKAAEK